MDQVDDHGFGRLLERARPYDPATAPDVRQAARELAAGVIRPRRARARALRVGAGAAALGLSFAAGAAAVHADGSTGPADATVLSCTLGGKETTLSVREAPEVEGAEDSPVTIVVEAPDETVAGEPVTLTVRVIDGDVVISEGVVTCDG